MTATPEQPTDQPTLTIQVLVRRSTDQYFPVPGWNTDIPGLAVVNAMRSGDALGEPIEGRFLLVHTTSCRTFGGAWSSVDIARAAAAALESALHLDWTTVDIARALLGPVYGVLEEFRDDRDEWPAGRPRLATDPMTNGTR